jgi:type VI secretion system protein ImpC
MAEQEKSAAVAEAQAVDLGEFSELLEKDFKVKKDDSDRLQQLVRNLALAAQSRSETTTISSNAIKSIKSLIAGIDKMLTTQVNEIIHAPEVREMEGTWRGLWYLVNNTETDQKLKIRVMNISKDALADTLEDYEGQMWDQSPVFKKVYTDEYSMFGGEPLGVMIGAYEFSNHPRDVGLLKARTPAISA